MKRYLLVWLLATAFLLALVAALNVLVDPYGILRLFERAGFNRIKPSVVDQGPMAKAYQVLKVRPHALLLGNSRVEVGLDPQHPAWPEQVRPVYNLALPGTGTAVSLRYLRHVLQSAPSTADQPKLVLWGIDFLDFLNDPALPRQSVIPALADRRLYGMPANTAAAQSWQRVIDLTESTLTLNALLDSVQTLTSQRQAFAIDRTPLGFNPMREYTKIAADEGYWALFHQKDQANLKSLQRQPRGVFDTSGDSSRQLEDLKAVLGLCRQHGIALQLFSHPYHAHYLEIFRITGRWQAFEQWQRAVVRILADEARTSGAPAFPFWTFSNFDVMTTEQVPAQGDRRTTMRWYWEAGHYKRELGDRMLGRMLDGRATQSDFGVLLTPANIDAHLANVRAAGGSYRQTHQPEIDALAALLKPAEVRNWPR